MATGQKSVPVAAAVGKACVSLLHDADTVVPSNAPMYMKNAAVYVGNKVSCPAADLTMAWHRGAGNGVQGWG